MSMPKRNSWICNEEHLILKTPVMDIVKRECQSSEDGRAHSFYLLKSRDWCNIIPVTADGKLVLVRQFRAGISGHTFEVPGGIIESSDADVQAAALREMIEETGYLPGPDSTCISLGWTYPNPAILDNRCHFFAVGPVHKKQDQHLDPGEMIEVVEMPFEEIPGRIASGEIRHALTINALSLLGITDPKGWHVVQQRLEALGAH